MRYLREIKEIWIFQLSVTCVSTCDNSTLLHSAKLSRNVLMAFGLLRSNHDFHGLLTTAEIKRKAGLNDLSFIASRLVFFYDNEAYFPTFDLPHIPKYSLKLAHTPLICLLPIECDSIYFIELPWQPCKLLGYRR